MFIVSSYIDTNFFLCFPTTQSLVWLATVALRAPRIILMTVSVLGVIGAPYTAVMVV